MKKILARIIRKRNPDFDWDAELDSRDLLAFLFLQTGRLLRGQTFWLRGRRPRLMLREQGVRFEYLHRIQWGRFLKLGRQVRLSALGRAGIVLGNHVGIGAYSQLVASTALNDIGAGIRIGHNVGIGEYAYLGGAGGLDIGDECIIGQYFSCHPENHCFHDLNLPIRRQGVSRQGIRIGQNCWIGSKVTILDGATIGNGCVIAAGAVITGGIFPDNCVIGGVPARVLKHREKVSIEA
ncbi:MAG: acyltransferase [Saprospiraceae bacterium]|nr:acyltransferase [Saprospiraceae bacterium]